MRIIKLLATKIINRLGFEIRYLKYEAEGLQAYAEGFPGYLREADKLGMDVNDWIEERLGWWKALPILEQTTFPYLRDDSIVCELGVGTGRWSRHIAAKLVSGELHLCDRSTWIVNFLEKYFQSNPRVHVHLSDGCHLPLPDNSVDLIFSEGTFIELKLGLFYLYSREFFRTLRSGGYAIFDYIDIDTIEGWNYLQTQSKQYWGCFTYHTAEVVDRVFSSADFEIIKRHQIDKSTYLVVRKPVADNNDGK